MRSLTTALLACGLMIVAATCRAEGDLSHSDKDFIEHLVEAGHAEIATGTQAAGSTNADISAFGRRMAADHDRMNKELMALAMKKGLRPPAAADIGSQAEALVDSAMPDATFERRYVSEQVEVHQQLVKALDEEVEGGRDADLVAFARTNRPLFLRHLEQAKALQAKMEQQ